VANAESCGGKVAQLLRKANRISALALAAGQEGLTAPDGEGSGDSARHLPVAFHASRCQGIRGYREPIRLDPSLKGQPYSVDGRGVF
jgi:hypothetical protein